MRAQRLLQADEVPGAHDLRLAGLRIELWHSWNMNYRNARANAASQHFRS
jgi:hypothetical protein